MQANAHASLDTSAASKGSSDFDNDFHERAKVLLEKRDSGLSLLRYSISPLASSSPTKEKSEASTAASQRLGASHECHISPVQSPMQSPSIEAQQHALSPQVSANTSPTSASVSSLTTITLPSVGPIKVYTSRKRRLPWLDGTRYSVPRTTAGPMPGAFADTVDDDSNASNVSSPRNFTKDLKLPHRSPSLMTPSVHEAQSATTQRAADKPIMRGVPCGTTPVPVLPLHIPARSVAAQYENDDDPPALPTEHDLGYRTRSLASFQDGNKRGPFSEGQYMSILKRPPQAPTGLTSVSRGSYSHPHLDAVQKMNSLMDHAVTLAADAADQGETEELAGIFVNANTAASQANAITHHQDTLAREDQSDSDHTSTYSSISSSSESEFYWDRGRHDDRARNSPQRSSAPSFPAIGRAGDIITRDWAYPGATVSRRTSDARRRRRTLPDVPQFRSSTSPPAGAESLHSLITHASLAETRHFEPLPRQPMGYEGPDSPFDKSPTADHHNNFVLQEDNTIAPISWGRDKFDEKDYVSTDALRGQRHITLKEGQRWSIHHHRRQPIARNWSIRRKRLTAFVTCLNTALIGLVIGIYAGEVPAIQFKLTDQHHFVNLGNVLLYLGMMVSSFLFWPLPLLHGRKPYTVTALAVVLPLHFPQALMVADTRNPNLARFRVGLLMPRALIGLALGFVHINLFNTLLDLFGASLQSEFPHGEVVILDDVRRHGGGMGLWLGAWSACFIGSLSVGFFVGAEIISGLDVTWGFYICVMIVAVVLLLDIMTPETRRSPHRRTMRPVQLRNMNVERRVGRGEVKIHVDGEGPLHWWEEVWAGVRLSVKMFDQVGFFLLSSYLAWVYAQAWLIIVLLGNLLSIEYKWTPEYIGVGALSLAAGAGLAIPLSRANLFSRSREHGPRTDSMTFQPRLTWTSHLVRRTAFMTVLPLAGMAYTLGSAGRSVNCAVPIAFAGLVGFVSNLAVAECHGIIMETFDTSDLQPGVNSRHRLQSLAVSEVKRRTSYSSYPRVSAGLAVAHSLGFGLAAAATGVSGALTRAVGAQTATGIVAGVLAAFTILLMLALLRYKSTKVIPNELFGQGLGSGENGRKDSVASSKSWRAVIIGNPSGRHRRMSLLELGGLSRWTEIRRLNRLLDRTTTQGLQPGWR